MPDGTLGRAAVVGAGAAGLTAARVLAEAGRDVTIFEKSRGVGGRMATRRPLADAPSFGLDHGAPAAHAATFSEAARLLEQAGGVVWPEAASAQDAAYAGPSGASALAGGLLGGAHIAMARQTEVASIARRPDGRWRLRMVGGDTAAPFDLVICAIPAPQARSVLREAGVPDAATEARFRPVLTVLVVFDDLPPARLCAPSPPLASIYAEAQKPRRREALRGGVVAHADASWSAAHLEREKDEIAALLIGAAAHGAGLSAHAPRRYLAGHRWRYGLVDTPAGSPYWISNDGRLGVCGDWRIGATVGAAIESGAALAREALARQA